MAATKLLLHHRYQHGLAYDWSGNANHGHLHAVVTDDPSGLAFKGNGASLVAIGNSTTLRDFGELRVRAIFKAEPAPVARRYNLVEGHLSFALVVNPDRSLQGTVNSPSAGWAGPLSPPGTVSYNAWHTADYSHDGISRGRLFLDGVLVAEHNAAGGPIPNLGPKGIVVGHWPEDDRYTLLGNLADVQIWKDDPKKDASRAVDDCCIDRSWVDDHVGEARRSGWTGESARDAFATLFGQMRAACAEVRGGSAARIAQIDGLTKQGMTAIGGKDAVGLEAVITQLHAITVAQIGNARAEQLGTELFAALRATPVGAWMGTSPQESLRFFEELAGKTCLGSIVPKPPERGKPDGKHPPEKLPPRDPATPDGSDVATPADPAPADEVVEVPPGVDPKDPDPFTHHDTPTGEQPAAKDDNEGDPK